MSDLKTFGVMMKNSFLQKLPLARSSSVSNIIPRSSIAGRTLWNVIAIMTFLACLTLGAVLMVQNTANSWKSDIAREVTIQIVPLENVDMAQALQRAEEIARSTPGVENTNILDWTETARLLEPWLGGSLKQDELPVPRLITVIIDAESQVNFEELRTQLNENVPGATLDDHRTWAERLTSMANTTVFAGFMILLLVLSATCLTVVFATRGALEGNRAIVEVLHFVGAEDKFIANQFQRHFFVLGLKGAAIGGFFAVVLFAVLGFWVAASVATPQADQTAAFFGQFSLSFGGYFALIVTACGIALLTGATARYAAHAYLDHVYIVSDKTNY